MSHANWEKHFWDNVTSPSGSKGHTSRSAKTRLQRQHVEPLLPLQSSESFMLLASVIMLCMVPAHGCVCLLVLEYKEWSLDMFFVGPGTSSRVPSKYYCSRFFNEFNIANQLQPHQMLCILAAEKKTCAHCAPCLLSEKPFDFST